MIDLFAPQHAPTTTTKTFKSSLQKMGCLLELLFWESNHWYIPAPWESVPTTTKTDPTNREYLAPRTSPSFFLLLVSNFWGEFLASKFLSLTTARASSNLMHNPLETAAKASKQPTMIFRDAQFGSVTHPQNNVDDLLLEFVFVVVGFFFFCWICFFFFGFFLVEQNPKKMQVWEEEKQTMTAVPNLK